MQKKLAVILTGGKQYLVSEGDILKIEKLPLSKEGDEVEFEKVLLVTDGEKSEIGRPYIEGLKIKASILKNARSKKITVIHYKPKVRYRKKYGHRQPFSQVKIGAFKM